MLEEWQFLILEQNIEIFFSYLYMFSPLFLIFII